MRQVNSPHQLGEDGGKVLWTGGKGRRTSVSQEMGWEEVPGRYKSMCKGLEETLMASEKL